MHKVKIFVITKTSYCENCDDDQLKSQLKESITDWVEFNDEDYSFLQNNIHIIQTKLRQQNIINYNDVLIIITELSDNKHEIVKVNIKALVQEAMLQQKKQEEKQQQLAAKAAKLAEKKKIERELKQLQKLQEKYNSVKKES